MGEIVNQERKPRPVGGNVKEIAINYDRKVPEESEKLSIKDEEGVQSSKCTKEGSMIIKDHKQNFKVEGAVHVQAEDDANKEKRVAVEQVDSSKNVQYEDKEVEKDSSSLLSSKETQPQGQIPNKMSEDRDEATCAPPNIGTGKVTEEETCPIVNNKTVIIFNSTTKQFHFVANEIKDDDVSAVDCEKKIKNWIASEELT